MFGGVAALLAAIPIALLGRETGERTHRPRRPIDEFPPEAPSTPGGPRRHRRRGAHGASGRSVPSRLWNRGQIAVLVINTAATAGGTNEVIWSLFLQRLGAGLDLIGLTFAMFGLPVLLLSPTRAGSSTGAALSRSSSPAPPARAHGRGLHGALDPVWAVPMILIEATGFAMLDPALYAVVAANSPIGRTSTAQGIFGAAGTVGFIVASLTAGVLAEVDIVYPMYVFSAVLIVSLVLGLLIGGRRLDGRPAAPPPEAEAVASLSLSTAAPTSARRRVPAPPCPDGRALGVRSPGGTSPGDPGCRSGR